MTDHQPPIQPSIPKLSPEDRSPAEEAGAQPHVTLEEVLEAGSQNLKLSLDIAGEEDLDFEGLYEVVEQTRSRVGANVSDSSYDESQGDNEGDGGVVLNEMQCLVSLLEAGTTTPDLENEAQAALERASIILHEAHRVIGLDTQQYGKAIDTMLRTASDVDVERFARLAITDMSACLPHHSFDAWMPAILLTARRAADSALCGWLSAISDASTQHAKEALWPYIVDELLVSLKDRSSAAPAAVYGIEGLHLGLAIERLTKLPAIHRSILAPGMFSLQQKSLHGLMIKLMDGPARHVVGPVLMAAFRETLPADPGISYCLFAARQQYDESIGWLLTEQLKDLKNPVHEDAQRSAAWSLLSSLNQLPPERRGEVWVPTALEWFGSRNTSLDPDVQVQGTYALLRRVISERRGLRKAWNRDCRRSASAALKNQAQS